MKPEKIALIRYFLIFAISLGSTATVIQYRHDTNEQKRAEVASTLEALKIQMLDTVGDDVEGDEKVAQDQ